MTKFMALLKLEFLSNRSSAKDAKLFSRIRKIFFTLLGIGAIEFIFVYAINVIMQVFLSTNMEHEFIIFFTTFMTIALLIMGITMSTKTLYVKVNLSILKLPVDGKDIFLSKFLYMYVKELFISTLIALPIFILFGIKTMQGVMFYILLLPNCLFLPVLPLFTAVLLSMPVMWIIRVFKNRFVILLILYIMVLVAAFLIYIVALKFVLRVLDRGDYANIFDSATVLTLKNIASYIFVPVLFKNSLLFYDFWRSALINFSMVLMLGFFIYIFANKAYLKAIISGISQKTFQKKTKVKHQSISIALMSKEFKNIFRSTNYAFQYLTVVISTPLMVYFSSEIASNIGVSALGKGILPGIAVLVLLMFLSMGTSFAATSITREGSNFFLTKIIPVSFKKQVFIKFLIYLFISVPSIFLSCFVLAFAGFIDYFGAFLMASALSLVIVGTTCGSIVLDIKKPQFQSLENGEVESNNKNISASIGVGFGIAILMGVAAIILSLFVNISVMYMVLFAFGVPYAAIELFRLFFRLEKRYNRIEV